MVLTDRQRKDLHAGIYEYFKSRPGEAFQRAAAALAEADPEACYSSTTTANGESTSSSASSSGASTGSTMNGLTLTTPLLEKKWTAIPRLQKKVLELERQAAQSAKIHAHRLATAASEDSSVGSSGQPQQRRMLPRLPCMYTLKGHSMGVTAVALHPIFTVVASGSEDGTIKIWDHESGDYMRTMKGHTNTVNSISFTPKGTHLASCSTDLTIKLWDFKTYTCLRTLRGHDHTISAVAFVPSLQLLSSEHPTSSMPTTTTGVDATAAGCQHLLSASRDATVKLWDIETGFCEQTYSDHNQWVRCLAVRQSDGALWASAGNDQTIMVYEYSNSNSSNSSSRGNVRTVELRGHEHVIESLAFVTEEALKSGSRETKHTETIRDYLASGSRDRTVRLWKVSEASCLAVFKAHENWVQGVLIHPNGLYVISCSDDKTIRVFDIKAQRCLRTLENAHDHFITSIHMHPTLPILVSGSVDQTVRCWQLD